MSNPKRRRIEDRDTESSNHDRQPAPISSWVKQSRSQLATPSLQSSYPSATTAPSAITPQDDLSSFSDSNLALDRNWYAGDDSGEHALGDDFHDPWGETPYSFDLDSGSREAPYVEPVSERQHSRRMNIRQAEWKRDNDTWEANRMLTSGVAQRVGLGAGRVMDDDDEMRVHVLVHDIKPPFLDGKTIFTKQLAPVSAVRDPQGDMAVLSRKGSKVVNERRTQRERARQAQAATDMKGTALGNIMGVTEDDETDSAAPQNQTGGARKKIRGQGESTNSGPAPDQNKSSSGQSKFSQTKTLREQRQFLPAFAVREELLRVIRDNQVIVVVGQTGSGKTTQLTQFLHEDGYGRTGLIGCTQPRRVAAMSVAKRVSEEMGVELGSTVGYAIRFEDCTGPDTVIKYMTDGVLLRESLTSPNLDRYSVIIMDEAHERALNTDVLMGLIKRVLARRWDLKLIVTSATLNSARFVSFFGGAPEFVIPGRTFPVDIQFARSPVEDYVEAAVKQVLSIHVAKGPGDILVFMTGQEDIEITCELIVDRLQLLNDPPPLSVLPLYSQMPADLQAKIFEKADQGLRKVIVATNIAETSLTVDGIMYVVDTGFSKLKVYNPRIGMDALQVTPVSQANASQRAGRAGRTGPGQCYHLFTERAFKDELYSQTIPEIQRTNLANTVLLLKSLGVRDLLDFDFMDPPPQETITTSLFDLWALGALDNLGNLTPMGQKMTSFPMDPPLAKLMVTSLEYGCTEEIMTIVSMLNVPSVFYRPKERQEESDQARERFFVPESDHLTLLNVYSQWKMNGFRDSWCVQHFLHPKALRRAQEIRNQLVDIISTPAFCPDHIPSAGMDWDIIRRCICSGYYHQAGRAHGVGQYANLRTSMTVQLHPTSALYGLGVLPDYIVYHELIFTSKEYMSHVTAVDPHWLADFGAVFYSIREKGYSNRDRRMTEREFNRKAEIEAQMEVDRQRQERERQDEAAALARPTKKQAVQVGGVKKRNATTARPVIKSDNSSDEERVSVQTVRRPFTRKRL